MKNLIMFFVLVMVMVFSNYEVSYSQEVKTGDFYFLVGTEGNERAIMYLYIFGDGAYGSYYTESQSITSKDGESGFSGSFDGRNLKLSYSDGNDRKRTITGTLSSDIVFRGKHNSKNVNLSLANAPVNSSRIIEEDYDKKFIFNVRALNNLDYYGRLEKIVYLDENIIIFCALGTGGRGAGIGYFVYSIHTGEQIVSSDIVSNSFLESLDLDPSGWDGIEFSFYITPDRKIGFYSDPGTIQIYLEDEGYGGGWTYWTPGASEEEFTFEEIKPFIKKGSPLDYLFN